MRIPDFDGSAAIHRQERKLNMKLTIDLDDAGVKAEVENAIGAKARELIAELVHGTVEEVLATKMMRLTPAVIDKMAAEAIQTRIQNVFVGQRWNEPSEFHKVLAEVAEKMIKEKCLKS